MKKKASTATIRCIRLCVNCGSAYLGTVRCPACKEATGMEVPDSQILKLLPVIQGDN